MTTRIFERAKVDEQGNIRGLEAHKGEEFLLVKAPAFGEGKSFEKPKQVLDEVVRYAREHRALAERQYQEFTTRYGDPAEKFREFTSHLTPEELQRRTKEIKEYAEKRAAEFRADVESQLKKLEKDVDQRAKTILKTGKNAHGAKNGAAVVTLDEQTAAGSVENRKDREREF